MNASRGGLTLLEAVIATTILGGVLALAFGSFSATAQVAAVTSSLTDARLEAERLLKMVRLELSTSGVGNPGRLQVRDTDPTDPEIEVEYVTLDMSAPLFDAADPYSPPFEADRRVIKFEPSGAEALFVFYPGAAGGAFIKQYQQSGLAEKVPLFSVFTVDALSLPRLQEAGLDAVIGTQHTQQWSPDLPFEQNQKFVSAFKEKYGTYPSYYAAQSYDAIYLIDSAVRAVGGDLDNMDGMREAMLKADYPSTRGPYTYGKNHFPIANFYLREVVVDDAGVWTVKTVETVFENHQDLHVGKCNM